VVEEEKGDTMKKRGALMEEMSLVGDEHAPPISREEHQKLVRRLSGYLVFTPNFMFRVVGHCVDAIRFACLDVMSKLGRKKTFCSCLLYTCTQPGL
jgi:hypothetical protein